MFLDGHEWKDVKEYRETFLHRMKLLLLYFIEFSGDGTIVSKKYLSDCAIRGPEKRSIIMIIYDKSKFSANNGCKKVWILNSQGILKPKRKEKEIMVSDF